MPKQSRILQDILCENLTFLEHTHLQKLQCKTFHIRAIESCKPSYLLYSAQQFADGLKRCENLHLAYGDITVPVETIVYALC